MTRTWALGLVACAGMVGSCDRLVDREPPEPGRFRVRTIANPGGSLANHVASLAVAVEVDYGGPNAWIELICENVTEDREAATIVLHREQFGAVVVEKHADGSTCSVERAPFAATRQQFVVSITRLEHDVDGDKNCFVKVATVDPQFPDTAHVAQIFAHLDAYEHSSPNEETWPFVNGEFDDSRAVEIWSAAHVDEIEGGDPPRRHVASESTLKIRFADH